MQILKKRTLKHRLYVAECAICNTIIQMDETEVYNTYTVRPDLSSIYMDCPECHTNLSMQVVNKESEEGQKIFKKAYPVKQ